MCREGDTPPLDMHNEAWWIRMLDGEITPEEQRLWQNHLALCTKCQRELEAFSRLDDVMMRFAPLPPSLSQEFTLRTVEYVHHRQRLRRMLSFLAGTLVVLLVGALVVGLMGSLYASLSPHVGVIISARQLLFRSLVQAWVGLLISWRSLLPFVVGFTLLAYLLIMPNGLLVTLGVVWLSRRRRTVAAGA